MKKRTKILLAVLAVVLGIICLFNCDYISFQVDKVVLSPTKFVEKYARIEIPPDAEIKSYKYLHDYDDLNTETLQATFIVPKEQVNYILYGQSTVPVPSAEDYVDEVLPYKIITPEDISPRVLEKFGFEFEDVELYCPKSSCLSDIFGGHRRDLLTADIFTTKADNEEMREIHIEIGGLGDGLLERE